MLFASLNQPKLFLIFLIIGFLCGFIFDIINFIKFVFKHNKVANIIFDFLGTIICFVIFFLINLKTNYGEFRLFTIMTYLLSFSFQRMTLGKLLAKYFLRCYNLFIKILQKLKGLMKRNEKHKKS